MNDEHSCDLRRPVDHVHVNVRSLQCSHGFIDLFGSCMEAEVCWPDFRHKEDFATEGNIRVILSRRDDARNFTFYVILSAHI